jgi:hypothetical protein
VTLHTNSNSMDAHDTGPQMKQQASTTDLPRAGSNLRDAGNMLGVKIQHLPDARQHSRHAMWC